MPVVEPIFIKIKVKKYINKSNILWTMFINLKVRRQFTSTKSN